MELNGAKVKHKTFGCGVVAQREGRYLVVDFGHTRKEFVYPDAFRTFLVIEDPTINEKVQNDLALAQEVIDAAEKQRMELIPVIHTESRDVKKKKPRASSAKRPQPQPSEILVKSPTGQQYFFVFQNKTFNVEHQGGYLWAPKPNANGRDIWHWKLMGEVHAGDVIFHIVNQNIVALSVASGASYSAKLPGEAGQEQAEEDAGRRVDCTYYILKSPMPTSEFKDTIMDMQPAQYVPFNASGRGNTGYLFASNPTLSKFLFDKITVRNEQLADLAETLGFGTAEAAQ